MRILDVRGQPMDKVNKLVLQYPARFYRQIGTEHVHRETTEADIKEFQKRAEKEGAVAIFIHEYGQIAYIPVERQPKSLPQTLEKVKRYYWVEKNEPYDSWAIVEAWPGGNTRSPFRSKEEAIKREEEIASYERWRLYRVPSPQEKSPKQHEALRKLYPYTIVEYRGGGNLAVRELLPVKGRPGFALGKLYLVTTDGQVIETVLPRSPQTSRDPIIEKGKEYWKKVNATQKAVMRDMGAGKVLEVHSDGDLTFEAGGNQYVLTTDGVLFIGKPAYHPDRPGPMPQTVRGERGIDYYKVPPEAY